MAHPSRRGLLPPTGVRDHGVMGHLTFLCASCSRGRTYSYLISSSHLEAALREAVATLSTLGELNFLLADGFHLVAYATGRLHLLERPCRTDACEDAAVFLATEPFAAEE